MSSEVPTGIKVKKGLSPDWFNNPTSYQEKE
jgi:hypothetical protein